MWCDEISKRRYIRRQNAPLQRLRCFDRFKFRDNNYVKVVSKNLKYVDAIRTQDNIVCEFDDDTEVESPDFSNYEIHLQNKAVIKSLGFKGMDDYLHSVMFKTIIDNLQPNFSGSIYIGKITIDILEGRDVSLIVLIPKNDLPLWRFIHSQMKQDKELGCYRGQLVVSYPIVEIKSLVRT